MVVYPERTALYLTVSTLLGTAWAMALVVSGLRFSDWAPPTFASSALARLLGPTAIIAAGEFVFLILVAGRVFPHTSRRWRRRAESTAAGVMVLAAAAFALAFFLET